MLVARRLFLMFAGKSSRPPAWPGYRAPLGPIAEETVKLARLSWRQRGGKAHPKETVN